MIATSDKPQIDLTIFSPANGIVTERKVTQRQYVNAGDVLFTVTDFSRVWVKADIYEAELPQVHVGQAVEITSESAPGAMLRGQLGFLEPRVNAQTRTTAARIEVSNPGMRLRPGAEVMKPLATPVLGGMVSSLLHVLIVTPVIFTWLREWEIRRNRG